MAAAEIRLCLLCAERVSQWIDITHCIFSQDRCQRCGALVWTVANVDAQDAADAGIVIDHGPAEDPDDPAVI